MNIICLINANVLYDKAIKENVPFFKVTSPSNIDSGTNGLKKPSIRKSCSTSSRTKEKILLKKQLNLHLKRKKKLNWLTGRVKARKKLNFLQRHPKDKRRAKEDCSHLKIKTRNESDNQVFT